MPSGKVHSVSTVVLAGGLAAGLSKAGFDPAVTLAAVQGCLAGIILTPDLDVNSGNIGHAILRTSLGRFVSRLWKGLWLPYATLIPHRSNLSHLPALGTAVRLGYLYGLYSLATFLISMAGYLLGYDLQFYRIPLDALLGRAPEYLLLYCFVLGLAASDTLHALLDVGVTFIKRRKIHARLSFPLSEMRRGDNRRTRHPRATSD